MNGIRISKLNTHNKSQLPTAQKLTFISGVGQPSYDIEKKYDKRIDQIHFGAKCHNIMSIT